MMRAGETLWVLSSLWSGKVVRTSLSSLIMLVLDAAVVGPRRSGNRGMRSAHSGPA